MRWLCDECEQRLSDAERPFAARIFSVVHSESFEPRPLEYEAWAHYLAVSVSWRSLLWCVETTPNSHLKPSDLRRVDVALSTWRDYLMGRRNDVGRFVQHMVPCGVFSESEVEHPFINRYFERTMQIDLVSSSNDCVVYSKMARIMLFGILRMDKPRDWQGSRLHLTHGVFAKPQRYILPPWLSSYWHRQSALYEEDLDSLSPVQKQKIAELMQTTDPDTMANSAAFRAFSADYERHGATVFADHPSRRKKG